MLNLTPLYLKLKIFQQMVEKLKVQVLALGNELLWKIKSNQSKMPTFCKIWGKKKIKYIYLLFWRGFHSVWDYILQWIRDSHLWFFLFPPIMFAALLCPTIWKVKVRRIGSYPWNSNYQFLQIYEKRQKGANDQLFPLILISWYHV